MLGIVLRDIPRQKKKNIYACEVYILVGGDSRGVDKYINKNNLYANEVL